ncbi:hypothetical protein [Streptomyces sp. cg35]|uniref:hypothetical protein n=1 Tax=Streptomyces sp. cg35 TaxID=3421650 RepID=UPI003D1693D2
MHADCRDLFAVCYACRYRQARRNSIAGDMLPGHHAGRAPFGKNRPTSATQGLEVPSVGSEKHRDGRSLVEVRILTAAIWSGWRIDSTAEDITTLRKHGYGYVRLHISVSGRIAHVSTHRQYLERAAARVISYLEESK